VSSLVVTAQTKQSGKVIGGDDKLRVVGASVRIKGTNTGAVTDVNGNFSLSLSPGNVLVVSYIGYQSTEVTVKNGEFLTVTLQPSNRSLNEVVVTGYTSQRKKDIAGAVAVVDVGDAKKLPAASSDQLLQGQAAGVTVVNMGAPGASSNVYIRGINNFGNSQPLYVIDGVQTSSMSQVNPNDIESIQVLKDAGSAAIYGVAGGNGVIVVTTKRGKAGKSVFTYDAYYSTQVPKGGNVYDALNPVGQSQLTWFADPNGIAKSIYPGGAGTIPTYGYQGPGAAGVTNDPNIANSYKFDASNPANDFLVQKFNQTGTDWFHAIFKAAPMQYHTISASGANDKNTYYMSVGYLNQQGTEIYTYYKRYEARINTTFNLSPHIRMGENGYFNYQLSPNGSNSNSGAFLNQSEGDPISYAYRQLPQIPIYDISGVQYGGTYDGPGGEPLGNSANPVSVLSHSVNDYQKTWNMQGNIYAEADVFKYFTVKMAIAGNMNNGYYYGFTPNSYNDYESHAGANSAYEGANYNSNYNWDNTILYKEIFGKHNISFLGGYEQTFYTGRTVGGNVNNLFSLNPSYVNLTNGATSHTNYSSINGLSAKESFFGLLNYIYNDKYILTATVRRDGSSLFYPGYQWGTFPSVSLAWRLSQEDFMKSISWIQDLKLRASYGVAGYNGNVLPGNEYTQYGSTAGNGYYAIGGSNTPSQGFYNSAVGNPKTSWEKDKNLNIGVDASLFNHLDIVAEYYQKNVTGLLLALPVPYTIGGAAQAPPTVNYGNIKNNGFDLEATYHGNSGDFKYSASANIGAYKNTIAALPTPGYFDQNGSRANAIVRNQTGHPVGEFFGYQTNGFYSAADIANPAVPKYAGAVVGSFKYADVNHDGVVNASDRTFIGNPNPDFTYGVNLNASYKNFDIAANFYGSHGNKDFHYTNYFTDFYSSFNGGKSNKALYQSYGSPYLKGTPTLPIQTDANTMGTSQMSSYYVEDGSFLKLRVLQIGYNFSPALLKSIGIAKLHVYVQGTNLFTITKYTGLDPEILPVPGNGNNLGVDEGNYPTNQRQYLVGVNMSF
ncbi:MAG: TonB-dependent receptor, partial [Mucilaginibacter sp.]|nr:TonB-dependent receptor [Mucilaginibacter sp.]